MHFMPFYMKLRWLNGMLGFHWKKMKSVFILKSEFANSYTNVKISVGYMYSSGYIIGYF